MEKLAQFYLIGISVRTSNENGQAMTDIPALWNKFMSENWIEKIPNKKSFDIYSVYTDYESDHTKPYTTLLACQVSSLDSIPEGLVGKTISAATYQKITAKGNIMEGLIYNEWIKIWNSDYKRTYSADFEIYGEKAKDFSNAEVDIYLAVK